MMNSGRPSGLTPWRMVRTQSSARYEATTLPGPGLMWGAFAYRPPSSMNARPAPSVPWQSVHPRVAYR